MSIAPSPMANAKNTPITVSLANPVFSRTYAIPSPTATPNSSMTGVTHLLNSAACSAPAVSPARNPRAIPANAQWARASLKNAIRLPTTSDPTAPQTTVTSTIASSPRTLGSSPQNEYASKWPQNQTTARSSQWSSAAAHSPLRTTTGPPKLRKPFASHDRPSYHHTTSCG